VSRSPFRFLLAAAAVLLAGPSPALAYCRQSVQTMALGQCQEMEGVDLLYWNRSCLTLVFNRDFFVQFPAFTEPQIREEFETGFATWREVRCSSGEAPFQVVFNPGVTDTNVAEFLYDVHNESLISARTTEQWLHKGRDPDALALTLLWHNPNTGEILDADMEFHAGAGRYGDCDVRCTDGTIDLLNAITHEAGHVLGLGHSSVPEATMWRDSDDGENEKRTLDEDDRYGLCALNLSGFECADRASCECGAPPKYSQTSSTSACGCSVPGATHGSRATLAAALAVLVVPLLRRRRRARD
jgi:MYXO-CTERM domain-containing protein